MEYLEKQYLSVKESIAKGKIFEDIAVFKVYPQKVFADTLNKLNTTNKSFLEVGCGGSLSIHYLSLMGHTTYGVDLSSTSIEYSNYLKNYFSSKTSFVKADAFNLPYDDNHIDVVYSIGMIEHFDQADQIKLCNEMMRVARKYVIVGIPNYSSCSAAYSTLRDGDEDHLDCSLDKLIATLDLRKVTFDGRGVFLPSSILDNNSEYKSILLNIYPDEYKDEYNKNDIKRLVAREKKLTPQFRRKHGFVEYFIGEV
ncbi:methyltransferase domain-containing protein [Marinomonas agarivorans]|nr:methyltransferase domain-containing protein [Marinomonas agarivorans]